MDSDFLECTPPELKKKANEALNKILPEKSGEKYKKEYQKFCEWCEENKVKNITENSLLAYFEIMSETKKASTMWVSYSMLKSCLSLYKNIDISKYLKLTSLLKRKSLNYEPKKSLILESEHINKFLSEADDTTFLAMKIILIMGYCGALRRDELTRMSLKDITLQSEKIIVQIPKTKNNVPRLFCITETRWIALIKKYIELRPVHTPHDRFFLTYREGRCIINPIGINKISEVPRNIAKFLKLPNSEKFTGHCFRRSSASHLANQGGDLLTIKKHGGWKSSTVAEGYVETSMKRKVEVAQMFTNDNDLEPSTSATVDLPSTSEIMQKHNQEEEEPIESKSLTHEIENDNIAPISISASASATITVNIYNNCTIMKDH